LLKQFSGLEGRRTASERRKIYAAENEKKAHPQNGRYARNKNNVSFCNLVRELTEMCRRKNAAAPLKEAAVCTIKIYAGGWNPFSARAKAMLSPFLGTAFCSGLPGSPAGAFR